MPPKKPGDPPPPPDLIKEQKAKNLLEQAMQDVEALGDELRQVRRETARVGDLKLPAARGMTGWPAKAEYIAYSAAERRRLQELDRTVDAALSTLQPVHSKLQ